MSSKEVSIKAYGPDAELVKGPLGSRIVDTRPLAGESDEDAGKRVASLVCKAVGAVTEEGATSTSGAEDIDAMMGIKNLDRPPIEATADGLSFRASTPAQLDEYKKHFGYRGN